MAVEIERLIVRLEGQIRAFERSMQKAGLIADRKMGQIERRGRTMQGRLNAAFSGVGAATGFLRRAGLGGGVLGVAGIGIATRGIQRAADEFTLAGNQIRAALAAREIVADVDEIRAALNDLAVDTRSDFGATVGLFARLTRATEGINAPISDVIRATEILNRAFQASGASSGEAASGVLQLAQALASGVLQGDELRSIRENAPVIAQAIADAFGTTIGGLKALGSEGKLTADRIFPAILAGGAEIDRQFATTTSTIGQGFGQVGTRVTEFIGELDKASGATESIAAGLRDMSEAIADSTDNAGSFVREMQNVNKVVADSTGIEVFPKLTARGPIVDFLFGHLTDGVRQWQESAERSVDAVFDLFDGPELPEARDRINEIKRAIADVTEQQRQLEAAGAQRAGGGPLGISIAVTPLSRLDAERARLVEDLESAERAVNAVLSDRTFSKFATGLISQLDAASAKMRELEDAANIEGTVDIRLTREDATAEVERITRELGQLGRDITFDVRPRLTENIGGLIDVPDVELPVKVKADLSQAQSEAERLRAEIGALAGSEELEIIAKLEGGRATREELQALIEALTELADPAALEFRAKLLGGNATADDLDNLQRRLEELRGAEIIEILARVEGTDQATGNIEALQQALGGLNAEKVVAITARQDALDATNEAVAELESRLSRAQASAEIRPVVDVLGVQQLKAELLPLLDPELIQIRAEVFNAPVVAGQLDSIVSKIDELRREQIVAIIARLETDRELPGDIDRLEALLQGVSERSRVAIQVQLADFTAARANLSQLTAAFDAADAAGTLRPTVDTTPLDDARRDVERLKAEVEQFGGIAVIEMIVRLGNGEQTQADLLKLRTAFEELIGPNVIEISARLENGTQTAEDIRVLRSLVPDRPEILAIIARFENGAQTRADVLDITGLLRDMRVSLDDIPALAAQAGQAFVNEFGSAARVIGDALELLNRFTGAARAMDVSNIRVRGPGLDPEAPAGRLGQDPALGINVLHPTLREGTEATKRLRDPLDDIAAKSERIADYNATVASGIPRIGDGIDTLPRDVVSGQRGDFDRVVSAIDRLPLGIGSAVGSAFSGGVAPERGTFAFGGAQNSLVGQSFSLGLNLATVVENAFESARNALAIQVGDPRVFGVPITAGADPIDIAADLARALGTQLITRDQAGQINAAIAASLDRANDHLAAIEDSTRSFDDRLVSLTANEARLARLGAALSPLSGSSGTSGGTGSGSLPAGSGGGGTRVVNVNFSTGAIQAGSGVSETEVRQIFKLAAGDFARELESEKVFR